MKRYRIQACTACKVFAWLLLTVIIGAGCASMRQQVSGQSWTQQAQQAQQASDQRESGPW